VANHKPAVASPESSFADFEPPVSQYESPVADPGPTISHDESPVASPEPLVASPDPEAASPEPPAAAFAAEDPAIAPANSEPLMAHLRPPAGIVTPEQLAAGAIEPLVPAEVWIEPSIEAPAPVLIEEPVLIEQPVQIEAPVEIAASAEPARPRSRSSRSAVKDSRSGSKDAELGIRGQRSRIKDQRLGALASWARSENQARDAAYGDDDLRGLLTGLAVPSSVVAVGYGRGCRIRRVRVPAAREPKEAESVGAVIISKRALAEQRASQG
jgi:hypothetical protein